DENSPDSAWLTGRITFSGSVYAQKSQLEDLDIYKNTNIHDTSSAGSYTPTLQGMKVNAGIRLVDNGFAQQSLTQFGNATLTLPGNDSLVQGQRVELSFANSTQTAIYYIKSVNGRSVTLSDSVDGAFNGNAAAVSVDAILRLAGSSPGAVTVKLLDAAASGATVTADNVITLTSMDIVPVTDASGNVTGYRALQNFDRVYLNDVRLQTGKTSSLQTDVAYFVLVGANNTIQLFASKEQAMLYQQINLLNQTPEGQALVKALFTDAGIQGELLTGFSAANIRGMFTVSTHLFQSQPAGSTAGLSAQMLALHEQLKNQAFDPNYLPAVLDLAAAQNLIKSTRNQVVYDYVVDKELAQTAEYHNYWRDRLTSQVGTATSGLVSVGSGSFKLANMNIVDDGTGQLRALRTGDEIYFRQSIGNVRADTAYYAIVSADGTIRLAASLSDAMLYQTGAGKNDGLLALYPNMGEAITLAFDASSLNGAN
ncbi:MAG: hypothetical protein ACRER5_10130, partial [Pseudomonas sp.]